CVKRNVGAEAATGEAFAFVDDDVIFPEGWAAAALEALDSGADAATGPSDLPYSQDFAQKAANAIICSAHFSLKKALYNRARCAIRFYEIALCNTVVTRKLWEEVGGFNEVAYYWADDAEFFYVAERLGFSLRNEPGMALAHHKRPLVWPIVKHYS